VKLGVPVSVDTYKPEVMQACLDLGADIVNDRLGAAAGDGAGRSSWRRIRAAACA
jgi:dihydropteroate synthase